MTKPLFISEVSSNHHRDLQRCFNFIDRSADIGCWGVKFQLFRIDELFAPEILTKSEMHRQRRNWELPEEFIPKLAQRCRQRGIAFGCTPFHLQAVEVLEPHVDFFKIASYELLWTDLLQSCAVTGKPVIISTGMATMDEIAAAVSCLKASGCSDLTLLHCVSSYPTPAAECNLAAMDTLRKAFDCKVGWSDHSVASGVINRAVNRWQASMIEFHLDLDGQGEEFAAGHCWLPEPMKEVILNIDQGLCADGDGQKSPVASELPDREWRADPSDGLRPFNMCEKDLVMPEIQQARSTKDLFCLKGRVALVTGGTGNGYGSQAVQSLAEAGATVFITSRNLAHVQQTAEKLCSQGLDVRGLDLDLESEQSISYVVDTLISDAGRLDILVNNACSNHFESFETVSLKDWNQVLAVNITGTMLISRATAPHMLENDGGVMINLSSIYGMVAPDQRIYGSTGTNSPLVYGMTKAALIQMTRYLATFWAPKIRVNCLTPGGLFNNQDEQFISQYVAKTPLGRMAGSDDLKGAILFLASDASAWVTGQNLVVDGGWTAW